MEREDIIKEGLFILEMVAKLDCECHKSVSDSLCHTCIALNTLDIVMESMGEGIMGIRREHPEFYELIKEVSASVKTYS